MTFRTVWKGRRHGAFEGRVQDQGPRGPGAQEGVSQLGVQAAVMKMEKSQQRSRKVPEGFSRGRGAGSGALGVGGSLPTPGAGGYRHKDLSREALPQ